MNKNNFEFILSGLMNRYKERVPDVKKICDALLSHGLIKSDTDIVNDHIAFRTMGVQHLGIASLEKIFLHHGYQKRDYYHFKDKKLDAFWYSPPNPKWPRIFISELRVTDFPQATQQLIQKYTDTVTKDPVSELDLANPKAIDTFLHSPLWKTPTWEDFQQLKNASEYASWVIYNRYYLNHYTITVSTLPEYNTIETFNAFVESIGINLNDAGGKIKTSQDGKLIQSSTVSQLIDAPFPTKDGKQVIKKISGSYVEFAQRIDGRDGFDAANANGIFESTYSNQTRK